MEHPSGASQQKRIPPAPSLAWLYLRGNERLRLQFARALLWLTNLRRRERRFLLRRLRVAPVVLALLAALTGAPHLALAETTATITVESGAAGLDDADLKCSLAEAIVNANNDAATYANCPAGSGADTIQLPVSADLAYSAPLYFQNALPNVTSAIVIEGNGSTVRRDILNAPGNFRVFLVSGAGDLTLKNLTVSGGSANEDGGGIFNGSTLTLINTTVSGNTATQYNGGGIASNGSLTLIQSTITNNTVNGYYGLGGGITTIGSCTISNSVISRNSANYGGGIYANNATVSVNASTINNNTAEFDGAGAMVKGAGSQFTLTNSLVSANESLGGTGGGGIMNVDSTLKVFQSTISQNLGLQGGGILSMAGSTTEVANSTLSGNEGVNKGGAISGFEATLTLTNTTITGNRAGNGIVSGSGGGVSNDYGTVSFSRSLVAGNIADSGTEVWGVTGAPYGGAFYANDYNLFGDDFKTMEAAFFGFSPAGSDVVATSDGTNVALADILDTNLTNSGGLTPTHNLVPGSPAIDLASAIACQAAPVNGIDQRGAMRLSAPGNTCDSGAVEFYPFTTAVGASSFASLPSGDGLRLSWWADASGGGLARFQLRRSPHGANQFSDLPGGVIPANPNAPGGQEYTFLDTSVQNGLLYDYELVPLNGAGQPAGPALSLSATLQRVFLPSIAR